MTDAELRAAFLTRYATNLERATMPSQATDELRFAAQALLRLERELNEEREQRRLAHLDAARELMDNVELRAEIDALKSYPVCPLYRRVDDGDHVIHECHDDEVTPLIMNGPEDCAHWCPLCGGPRK